MTDGVDYCKTCYHPKADHLFNGFDANASCGLQECECVDYVYGETRVTSATGASKGTKEARYDLIPIPALDLLARLYGKGAVKYAAHNWRLGYDWSKSYAAAQRHMNTFWSGEDIDPETGIPHPICASFHMFALTTYLTEHPELDDRFETRERRSDDGTVPATEDEHIYLSIDGERRTQFFLVKSKQYAGGWVNQGFFFSKEKAEQRIKDLQATHTLQEYDTEYQIFEGVFQDG